MSSPVIELRDVWFAYPGGAEVLRGVSLGLDPGESLALMGPSGTGKSTLARHLNGLLRPSQGQVLMDGHDTSEWPVARLAREVGYVFQNPLHQLFTNTVREEVALALRAQGTPRGARGAMTEAALARLHLETLADRHPLALSEGQRKRVALAAVIVAGPRVLVLDEPTLGQDAAEKARLLELISELRSKGTAVLVVTHDVEFALDVSERLAIMQDGRLRTVGPALQVAQDEQAFLAARIVPPQIAALGRALGWPPGVLTVEQAVEAILAGA